MNRRYVFPAIFFFVASYLTRFYETVMNHPFITVGDFNVTPVAVIIATIVIYGIVTIDAVLDTVAARSSAYPVPVNNAGFVHEHTSSSDVIDIEVEEIPVEESKPKSKPEEVPEPIFMEYEQPPYEDVPR